MDTHKDSPLVSFIQENQEKLYRIAYAHVKNREDALDLVQRVKSGFHGGMRCLVCLLLWPPERQV